MYPVQTTENTGIMIYDSGELTTADNRALNYQFQRQWFDDFIKYLDATPKTVKTYTEQLRQFDYYYKNSGIQNPSREDIIAYREYLKATGHKPTTIQNYIAAVKVFFNWTEQARLYPNVAAHVKGAKLDREHKKDYFTENQVAAILTDIDRSDLHGLRDYAIFALMVTCGLRTIEVVRADICDMRAAGNNTVLYVQGKGHEEKGQSVKIPPQTEKAIRAYLKARNPKDETEPLFTSLSNHNGNGRMTTRSISRICKERMQQAGFNSDRLTAHSLRHTAVTLSLLAGNSLEDTQKFARHSNLATTMIYNHAIDAAKNNCSTAVADAIFGAEQKA